MKEVITSIKERLMLIEDTSSDLSDTQKGDLSTKLNRIDKELRGIILIQMAINKR